MSLPIYYNYYSPHVYQPVMRLRCCRYPEINHLLTRASIQGTVLYIHVCAISSWFLFKAQYILYTYYVQFLPISHLVTRVSIQGTIYTVHNYVQYLPISHLVTRVSIQGTVLYTCTISSYQLSPPIVFCSIIKCQVLYNVEYSTLLIGQ